jgi:hypothetical protein
VKPYFFDIAYNYFGSEGSLESGETKDGKTEKKDEGAKKGWFWR